MSTASTAIATSTGSPGEIPVAIGRRSFLRSAGLGAATLLVVGDGLLAYRAYDHGVLSEGRGPAFRAVEDWRTYGGPVGAVAAAVLAASAHNIQPWLFAVFDDRIDVFADLGRRNRRQRRAESRASHLARLCGGEPLPGRSRERVRH